jgi:restriction endonuclease Mrr
MAVPDFQSFFKPLLDVAADGKEHSMKEAREIIANCMNIAEEDLQAKRWEGTVGWPKIQKIVGAFCYGNN